MNLIRWQNVFRSSPGLCALLVIMAGTLHAEPLSVLHVGQFAFAEAGGAYPDSWKP